MKPSDLSIGDWVQVIGTDYRCRVEEIMSICTLSPQKKIMLGVEGDEFYFIDEVEPIRINGEILKKNNFIRSDSEPKFFHPYGESEEEPAIEVVEIIYDLTHDEWTGEFFGPEGLAMQVRIRYVHELQRIMRCMGIDHDIVL